MESIDLEEGWDRTFLDISSKLAEPICWAYGLLRYRMVSPLDKFDSHANKIVEIATRAFIAITAIFALVTLVIPIVFIALGLASKITRAIGFALQKDNYTHIRGQLPEKTLDGEAKILTWNICGIGGGMHYDHGGVISWRSRLEWIVGKIQKEDPDVLVLQEIYDTALLEALIAKLGPQYAHFFAHLGPNVMGSVSGELVITKCAVNRFTSTSFENNDWTLNRTFTTLDIKAKPSDLLPAARIVGTHLIHDDNAKRMVQVAQVVHSLAKETLQLPTVLAGDLNLEREKADEGRVLDRHFIHGYQGTEPTCTNELVRQWDPKKWGTPGETIDYISLFRNNIDAQLVNTRMIKAYTDDYNTRTALSDHNALVSTLRWGAPAA